MSFTESSHRDAKNRTNTPEGSQKNSQYEQVMCFGTFDLFHPGHVYYLSEAEKLAKVMTVIVARDARVSGIKGRPPKHDEDTRLHNVAHAFRDARVILGDENDIFLPLRAYKPDILAFGYDQRVPEDTIVTLFPGIEIVRIGGFQTDTWKSSLLREGVPE